MLYGIPNAAQTLCFFYPQELGAREPEVQAELLHRQLEYTWVHGVEQARKGYHSQPDPLPAAGLRRSINTHDLVLIVVFDLRPQFLE